MQHVVLHGLELPKTSEKYFLQIIAWLKKEEVAFSYTASFYHRNAALIGTEVELVHEIASAQDVVFSLGGDGTFLETLLLVGSAEVPILGINMGRLGFLASIAKEYIEESLHLLFQKKYEIEKRSLVSLHSDLDLFEGKTYALNECALLRKDSSAMIKVKCYINEQYLNTYWADGLMVSTPTGSTGYSLSCGGPLMMPDSKDFIITPVSPHNLNVRPLIISDDSELRLEVASRNRSFLVSLDSRSETISGDIGFTVKKALFQAKLIRLHGMNFPDTIRNKLGWGFDKRN